MNRPRLRLARSAGLAGVLLLTAGVTGSAVVFNFDGAFARAPAASSSSSATVWSFGFSIAGQRRFRDPAPQSYGFIFTPSAAYVISEQWNASFSMPITRRWFDISRGSANAT